MRATERQRNAGNPAYGLTDHVFSAEKGGGGFGRWPLRVAEPGRVVGDQPRRLEIRAHLGDMPAHVRVIGEWLHVPFRLAGVDHRAEFVKRRLCDTQGKPEYTNPRTSSNSYGGTAAHRPSERPRRFPGASTRRG